MLKVLLIAVILIVVALAGMSIRILFTKKGEFSGGSCSSSPGLESRGITCACGGHGSCKNQDVEPDEINALPAD